MFQKYALLKQHIVVQNEVQNTTDSTTVQAACMPYKITLLYCYQDSTLVPPRERLQIQVSKPCYLFRYCRLQSHSSTHSHLTTKRIAKKLISPSPVVVFLPNQEEPLLQLQALKFFNCSSNHLLSHVRMVFQEKIIHVCMQ